MSQNTSHAVMAQRDRTVEGLDFFPTPPWAARAGGELIQRLDPGKWDCWEPAAGQGHMVHGLEDHFTQVNASDVHAYDGPIDAAVIDFLAPYDGPQWDWIVTNPPFVQAEAFARVGLRRARRGVALLCRLAFLEGAARHQLLYIDHPLTVCAPFAERVPMVKGRWDPDASSATAYAWFIWDKRNAGYREKWSPRLIPIPPGTKKRLTKPDDAALFGVAADVPLFAESDARGG